MYLSKFYVFAGRHCYKVPWLLKHCRWGSSDIIYTLTRRGLIKETFPKDLSHISSSGLPTAYAGFDATSDSLHIGNLLVLVSLIHWQRAGNKSIVVIGDSTAMVGDPSGHNEEREALSEEFVKSNADSIENSIQRLFDNHESFLWCRNSPTKKLMQPVRIFRNSQWYMQEDIVQFMCNVGKYVRVSEMLSRSSVKSRMDSGDGINFSEFSYQLFQAYDWYQLLKKEKCKFQFGGGDQMGNIVTGYELITNACNKTVYGLLLPLIESEEGNKYGKSSGHAVYLNANRTSPFDLYQFFMRIPDKEVEKFLRLLTFLPMEEIDAIVKKHLKNPDGRFGQTRIAEEVLLLVHGEEGLEAAKKATKAFYASDLDSLVQMDLQQLKQCLPPSSMVEMPFEHGLTLLDLTLRARCFLNEADANRIIKSGGVYINFQRTTSPDIVITPGVHLLPNSSTLLRIGKKTYYLVAWQ